MKTAIKIAIAGAAVCALATQAFAYTLSGTIPPGRRSVVLHLHQPLPAGMTILTLSAPLRITPAYPYALLVVHLARRRTPAACPATGPSRCRLAKA